MAIEEVVEEFKERFPYIPIYGKSETASLIWVGGNIYDVAEADEYIYTKFGYHVRYYIQ